MNVVFITSIGYPIKLSANTIKTALVARGLNEAKCKVTIVDYPVGTLGVNKITEGVSEENLKYILLPYQGLFKSMFSNMRTIRKILISNKEKEKNIAVIGVTYYHLFVILNITCRLLGYKRVSLFHEWTQTFTGVSFIKKIESYINDYTFGYFINGILPISHFLIDKAKRFKKATYLLPILSVYKRKITTSSHKNHFAYCASIAYLIRNQILLEAFSILHNKYPNIELHLVLNGKEEDFKRINKIIEQYKISDVTKVKTQLLQEDLYNIYDSSIGLIIPLNPNSQQDISRFSQKIAEYLESQRPIITSNVGEIPYYFKHRENAMIAEYTAEDYAKCMIELVEEPDMANTIGINGYNVGKTHFNSTTHGKNMKIFFQNL